MHRHFKTTMGFLDLYGVIIKQFKTDGENNITMIDRSNDRDLEKMIVGKKLVRVCGFTMWINEEEKVERKSKKDPTVKEKLLILKSVNFYYNDTGELEILEKIDGLATNYTMKYRSFGLKDLLSVVSSDDDIMDDFAFDNMTPFDKVFNKLTKKLNFKLQDNYRERAIFLDELVSIIDNSVFKLNVDLETLLNVSEFKDIYLELRNTENIR